MRELGAFLRQRFVVVLARYFGIKREVELIFTTKREALTHRTFYRCIFGLLSHLSLLRLES